jgi:hypothetical protein
MAEGEWSMRPNTKDMFAAAISRSKPINIELDSDDIRMALVCMSYALVHYQALIAEVTEYRSLSKSERIQAKNDEKLLNEMFDTLMIAWSTGADSIRLR